MVKTCLQPRKHITALLGTRARGHAGLPRERLKTVATDLMEEGDGLMRRMDIELLCHGRGTPLVLTQRGRAVAGLVIQPHQITVSAFTGRIVAQDALAVSDAFRVAPPSFVVGHQLF